MRFGEYLVENKVLTKGSINHALGLQYNTIKTVDRRYRRLANLLLLICAIDEETLVKHFNKFNRGNNEYITTTKFRNSEKLNQYLTLEEQRKSESVILYVDDDKKRILVGTITNNENTLMKVKMILSKERAGYTIEVKKLLEVPYLQWVKRNHELSGQDFDPLELRISVDERLKTVFRNAVENKATDISIESQEKETYVYLTIDKERTLFKNVVFTPQEASEVTNWIITRSGIGQTHATQKVVDCALPVLGDIYTHRARVNIITTYHGIVINMRVLPNKPDFIDLDSLNYSSTVYKFIKYLTKPRKGLVLIVGPTNSGKNTSIFAIISELLKKFRLKIISLEQPVEYLVPGVQQINATDDDDYKETARALVRQSPDVIYLSEIRDHITMDTALNVSNTGKLVLSTLHVSNAYDIFNRAEDVYGSDISAKLLSELIGVVNQVLIPKACPKCLVEKSIETVEPVYRRILTEHKYRGLIHENTGRNKDTGEICQHCKGNGYKGIVPISEFINFDENLKRSLRRAKSLSEKEEIMMDVMRKSNNSLLYDALRNMATKKVSMRMLIEKQILDTVFDIKEES